MDYVSERKRLVDNLVSEGYLETQSVIDAMLKIPRERFVPEAMRNSAYADCPLPIGEGQTISAPHMVAIMTEKLQLGENHVVLEVGSGSGYQAAVLAEIAKHGFIYTIERVPTLVEYARNNLRFCGIRNVEIVPSDGTLGYSKKAPYDRIIVTAAAPKIPKALVSQLKEDGLLLIPVGNRFLQTLVEVRKEKGKVFEKNHGGCVFVPLIGEDGWN
ncbi:MAG: protein-L-isoaspartate(D-aspartate) O-methyltransferase [Candidatus Altiarchaeales archaeon]|nr:protein-L-isoaspartate(D-aspartate) O-methyltransferase [Candidatus Altiarchaeales archaeon]